ELDLMVTRERSGQVEDVGDCRREDDAFELDPELARLHARGVDELVQKLCHVFRAGGDLADCFGVLGRQLCAREQLREATDRVEWSPELMTQGREEPRLRYTRAHRLRPLALELVRELANTLVEPRAVSGYGRLEVARGCLDESGGRRQVTVRR